MHKVTLRLFPNLMPICTNDLGGQLSWWHPLEAFSFWNQSMSGKLKSFRWKFRKLSQKWWPTCINKCQSNSCWNFGCRHKGLINKFFKSYSCSHLLLQLFLHILTYVRSGKILKLAYLEYSVKCKINFYDTANRCSTWKL